MDINDEASLDNLVARNNLIIRLILIKNYIYSLVPYTYHATVIKSAIKFKKNVCTTSYISPQMMELDQQYFLFLNIF